MLVYPPGIALMVPGERIGRNSSPMVDYMLAFEALENAFPGLSTEIQGVYRETQPGGGVKFYTYVIARESEVSGAEVCHCEALRAAAIHRMDRVCRSGSPYAPRDDEVRLVG